MSPKQKRKTKITEKSAHKSLASLLRKQRIQLGFTENEVIKYLGNISIETFRLYEAGKKDIPKRVAYALSNCLNIAPSTIDDCYK